MLVVVGCFATAMQYHTVPPWSSPRHNIFVAGRLGCIRQRGRAHRPPRKIERFRVVLRILDYWETGTGRGGEEIRAVGSRFLEFLGIMKYIPLWD